MPEQKTVHYNDWIFDMIKPYIGSGYGTFISYFKDKEFIISIEPEEAGCEYQKDRFRTNKNIEIINNCFAEDSCVSSLARRSPYTVICINVL